MPDIEPMQKIADAVRQAMKSGDARRLDALRFLLSALQRAQKDFQGKAGLSARLSGQEQILVLQKEAKRRQEAVELYEKGGRRDLADKERFELDIISEYLPAALSSVRLDEIISEAIAEGHKEFPGLMKEVIKRGEGRVDGKRAAERVRAKLAEEKSA